MKILDRSIEIARALYPNLRDFRKCFHWTIVWDKNRLVVIGENSLKTTSRNKYNQKRENFSLGMKGFCSELSAFVKLKNTRDIAFSKLTWINIRIDRTGRIRNSFPCAFCRNLLDYLSVKKLYHTNDEGKFSIFLN